MRTIRFVSAGLAVCFVVAAVISYIATVDRIEATPAVLGAVGFGFGVLSLVVGRRET